MLCYMMTLLHGGNLTLIKHVNTREEAELVQQEYEEKVKNGMIYADAVYIYDENTLNKVGKKIKLKISNE